MLIEVKEKHPPEAEKRPGTIVATTGDKFDAWQEVFGIMRVGMSYEIETKARQWKDRTFYSITKATPTGTAPSAAFARQTAPAASLAVAGTSGEAEFVGRVLAALILKGEVQDHKISSYTARLRQIWRETDPAVQVYSQAAE